MALYLSNFSQYLQFCSFSKPKRAQRIFTQRYLNRSISVSGKLAAQTSSHIQLLLPECPSSPDSNYNLLIKHVGPFDPIQVNSESEIVELNVKITSFGISYFSNFFYDIFHILIDDKHLILHTDRLARGAPVDYTISCQEIFSLFTNPDISNIWKDTPVSLIGCLDPRPSERSLYRFFVLYPCINNAMNPVFLDIPELASQSRQMPPEWILIDGYLQDRQTSPHPRHVISVKYDHIRPVFQTQFENLVKRAISIEKDLIMSSLKIHDTDLLQELAYLPTLTNSPPPHQQSSTQPTAAGLLDSRLTIYSTANQRTPRKLLLGSSEDDSSDDSLFPS